MDSREVLSQKIAEQKEIVNKEREKLYVLENEERERFVIPEMKKKIGICYKYHNCYSCPEKPSDYWWIYIKIIGLKDDEYITETFQEDKFGWLTYELNHPMRDSMLDSAKKIKSTEYETAKKKFFLKGEKLK